MHARTYTHTVREGGVRGDVCTVILLLVLSKEREGQVMGLLLRQCVQLHTGPAVRVVRV